MVKSEVNQLLESMYMCGLVVISAVCRQIVTFTLALLANVPGSYPTPSQTIPTIEFAVGLVEHRHSENFIQFASDAKLA